LPSDREVYKPIVDEHKRSEFNENKDEFSLFGKSSTKVREAAKLLRAKPKVVARRDSTLAQTQAILMQSLHRNRQAKLDDTSVGIVRARLPTSKFYYFSVTYLSFHLTVDGLLMDNLK